MLKTPILKYTNSKAFTEISKAFSQSQKHDSLLRKFNGLGNLHLLQDKELMSNTMKSGNIRELGLSNSEFEKVLFSVKKSKKY